MDLKSLQTFLSFCKHMNMTASAKELAMTQSAVSQQIKHLENDLQARLVDRDVRPLRLTSAGKILKCRGVAIVEEITKTSALLRHKSGLRFPHLTIGLLSSFSDMCLPTFFKGMSKLVDQLSMRTGSPDMLAEGLMNRDLDMIITSSPFDAMGAFESHNIMEEPFVVLYHKSLQRQGQHPSLDVLAANYPLIGMSNKYYVARKVESFLRVVCKSAPTKVEVPSYNNMAAMVEANMGWTVISTLLLANAKRQNRLTDCAIFPLPNNGLKRKLILVSHQDELADLPIKIAKLARQILCRDWLDEIAPMVGCIKDAIVVY